jgi:hypothetical protein
MQLRPSGVQMNGRFPGVILTMAVGASGAGTDAFPAAEAEALALALLLVLALALVFSGRGTARLSAWTSRCRAAI